MKVKLSELKEIVTKALTKYNYNAEETKAISEVLLYAQMRGNNQGVVKLIGAGIPNGANGAIEVVKDTKVSAIIDAHQNHAMVAVNQGADLAIQKAKQSGIAVVGVHGINTSSGAIGFYARKIAQQNLVGFIYTAAALESVATEGSYQATLGTNPLAIGVPAADKPLVLDMATAAMAYFGVIEANTAGIKLPDGIAYDKEGNLTNEPAKVLDDGALRTFDKGHKGSHLSMMVQILAGPLVGGAIMGATDVNENWGGHLIIAIDPEVLGGLDALKKAVNEVEDIVKAGKKLPGTGEILMPSERGDRLTQQVEQSGEIEVEDNLYKELQKVAQ